MIDRRLATVFDGYAAAGISLAPIIVVAAGEANMVGGDNARNGPFFPVPAVSILDVGQRRLRGRDNPPLDLSRDEVVIYCGDESQPIRTIGGGRNNLAVAFAYRLARETGRECCLIFNATNSRHSRYWLGQGRDSVDWRALNADVGAALKATGAKAVDFFLWQHGETDVRQHEPGTPYADILNQLRNQAMAETWWANETVMIVGKPCSMPPPHERSSQLEDQIQRFAARRYENVGIAENVSPYFPDSPYFGDDRGIATFTGRSLYSLGYFNYWNAVPGSRLPYKKSFAQLWEETPYPADTKAYAHRAPTVEYRKHLAHPSKYNLAPSITGIGSRIWMGWTANMETAEEGKGQFCKLAWSDDGFATIKGLNIGGEGLGFTGANAAEPALWACPDGSLWCFMMSSASSQVFDGRAGVWLAICRNPTANKPVFSAPKLVSPWGWCQPPIQLNGKWYLPVSYWRLPKGGGFAAFVPALAGRHLLEIDYSQASLTMAVTISRETMDSTYDEQNVVVLPSGDWFASWRTLSGPVFSESRDRGVSWSEPAPFALLGPDRPSSRHRVRSSSAGHLLCAWNDAAAERRNLTLGMLDFDEKQTSFKQKLVLEPGPSSYPDIYADGRDIYVIYDNGDRKTTSAGGTGGKIRVAKVSEAMLAKGRAEPQIFTIDSGA